MSYKFMSIGYPGHREVVTGTIFASTSLLPSPWHSIPEIVKIIEAFENPTWIGQLRERWKEIKKLHARPLLLTNS